MVHSQADSQTHAKPFTSAVHSSAMQIVLALMERTIEISQFNMQPFSELPTTDAKTTVFCCGRISKLICDSTAEDKAEHEE